MEAWWKVVRVATLGWKRHTPTRRCPLSRTCGPDGRVHAISEKECPAPVQTTVSLSLSPTTSCERRENAYVRAFSAPLSLSRTPVSGREKPLLLSFQMAPVLFRLGCSLGR